MQKIIPAIWCNGDATEAADFYVSVFRDARVLAQTNYPTEGLLDFQKHMAGQPLTVDVEVHGLRLNLINAGDEFRPTPSISFLINADPLMYGGVDEARAYISHIHNAILENGGSELMALDEYPHSPWYAWIADRFGVTWQLMFTNADGDERPPIVPTFLFGGPQQNKAKEATDTWISLFSDSRRGALIPYDQEAGPAVPGSVMFTDFQLSGQWFAAMDSAVEQPFTFTPGISLMVGCADQTEIDRYWEVLSTVPEAEQCGWCQDAYGVSWQVGPFGWSEEELGPEGYAAMMSMGKLDIAALRAADGKA